MQINFSNIVENTAQSNWWDLIRLAGIIQCSNDVVCTIL